MTKDERWWAMHERLETYRVATDSPDVPRSFVTAEGWSLGAWLHRQRTLHRQHRLFPDREKALEALEVTWSKPSTRQLALDELTA